VVNVSHTQIGSALPLVTQDDVAVGRLAAQHLRGCGCRSFGFWGDPGRAYSEERLLGFRAELGLHGQADALQSRLGAGCAHETVVEPTGPAGGHLRGARHRCALGLIRSARQLGWRVPEDVAILGAGDDDFWVEFERVPLSSVRLPARRIGYEAASLLTELLERGPVSPPPCRRLPVEGIAARKSTDVIYAGDPAVARALRFIREQALRNPYVGEVARAAGIARTALQSRFRSVVGRTILHEIQRTQLARAQELLTTTDLPLAMIAEQCAFPNSQRFSVVFRQRLGVSPSSYRRQYRPAGFGRE
jgi:LacI family transcriptional regulator